MVLSSTKSSDDRYGRRNKEFPTLTAMTTESDTDHRRRLLDGLATTLVTKQYRDVTLTDIAAEARVSRRTFYEQFSNKDDCLLALADQTSKEIMTAIVANAATDGDWPARIHDITHSYLMFIHQRPQLMQALYIELAALGDAGLEQRHHVVEQFAVFLRDQVQWQRDRGGDVQPLSLPMSMALVAGINELILQSLSGNAKQDLMSLAPDAEALIHRVTSPGMG